MGEEANRARAEQEITVQIDVPMPGGGVSRQTAMSYAEYLEQIKVWL